MGRPGAVGWPSARWTSRLQLARLPEEILLLILERCDIDALLQLRLTSRAFRSLIATYESTIVQAVARTTFPGCKLILRPPEDHDLLKSPYTLEWLTGLIPKHLAAIIVDRHRHCGTPLPALDGIPAEDEIGDEIREHIAHGFRILETLSLIAQDVEETPDSKIESKLPPELVSRSAPAPRWHKYKPSRVFRRTKTALWSWRRPQESAEKKKWAILQRRQDLTTALQCNFIYKRMTPEEAADFDAMWTVLRMAFQHHRYFNIGVPLFDWGKPDMRDVFWGNSWVNWYVLHAGASFWWRNYWVKSIRAVATGPKDIGDFTKPSKKKSRPKSSRKDSRPTGWTEIRMAWHVRTREQIEIERAGAEEVFATIKHRMKGVNAIRLPTFDEYRGMVRSLRGEGSQAQEDHIGRYCANMTLQ
ncbi:F-box domain cyclin-like protein [Botryosphaeria dothidea]|uniref:F-box domain cyclin-like protein n=1 Tax=Botryosphaeria dothidea TaxID=55169 RepID=A0A8H4ISK3_9PEZI|nr:F-box domain cyclin-like protein [Botryosphaeria dothidea]